MARVDIIGDLNTCIALGLPKSPLIFPIFDELAVRLAGEIYHNYSTNAIVMANVWNKIIQDLDIDWAGLFVDDLFEYEPLGIDIADSPHHPFAVTRYLPAEENVLNRLKLPNPRTDCRMPVLLEAQRRIRERWGNSIIISNSVAAPFTGLTLLYGIDTIMMMIYDDPAFLKKSMTFLEELAITWGRALIEGGTDLIWLGDCSASSRFISTAMFREFAREPAQRVISELKKAGGIVLYHAGENKLPFLEETAGLGADILSVEAGINLAQVKSTVGKRIALSGNLDGIKLLWNSTPAMIEQAASRLTAEVASQGGVIVNTGEGIPEQTPLDNVQAMIRGIRNAWSCRASS